jgi:hypothetical protein
LAVKSEQEALGKYILVRFLVDDNAAAFSRKLLIKEKVAFLSIFLYSFKSDFYFTFLGINVINGEEVAIKIESIRAKHPQLEYEARVYKALTGGGKS